MNKVHQSMTESASLPTTTKGDLLVHNGATNTRLAVGAGGYVLTADSGQPTGMRWAAPSGGGGSTGRIVGEVATFAFSSPPAGWLNCDGSAVSRSTYAALFAAIGTAFGAGDGSTTFNLPNRCGRVGVGAGSGSASWTTTAVDATANTVTLPAAAARSIYTGTQVTYTNSGGTPIGGLTSGGTYYAIVTATSPSLVIKLASNRFNAVVGTALDLTSAGSGTHAFSIALTSRAVGDVFGEEEHTLTVAEIPSHSHPQGRVTVGGEYAEAYGGASSSGETGDTGGSGAHNQFQPGLALGCFIYSGV